MSFPDVCNASCVAKVCILSTVLQVLTTPELIFPYWRLKLSWVILALAAYGYGSWCADFRYLFLIKVIIFLSGHGLSNSCRSGATLFVTGAVAFGLYAESLHFTSESYS